MQYNDFLLDDEFDLLIEDNDLVIGNADEQDMKLLLLTMKGEWKTQPLTGAGLERFQKSTADEAPAMVKEIKSQLAQNGFQNIKVDSRTLGQPKVSADRK